MLWPMQGLLLPIASYQNHCGAVTGQCLAALWEQKFCVRESSARLGAGAGNSTQVSWWSFPLGQRYHRGLAGIPLPVCRCAHRGPSKTPGDAETPII